MKKTDGNTRVHPALFGAIVGDALGVPVEFSSREKRRADPVTGMRAYGVHHQPAGTWSDDSSMLLCLAESVSETGWNLGDQMARYARWLNEGYMTPHGEVFDVGGATRAAIRRFQTGTEAAFCGGRDERDNGNGSLMRCLPAALCFAHSPDGLLAAAMDQSSILTHAHPRSRLACVFFGFLVSELVRYAEKTHAGTEERVSGANAPAVGTRETNAPGRVAAGAGPSQPLAREAVAAATARLTRVAGSGDLPADLVTELPSLERIVSGRLHTLAEAEIQSSGYVVHTLEAAIWCVCTSDSYRECVLKAVNLGEDTDTTACVAGGLAGLLWGTEAIPREWSSALADHDTVERVVSGFSRLMMTSVPFENAYTVLPGKLYAGQYPRNKDDSSSRVKLGGLLDAGVTVCIDLTEPGEHRLEPYDALLEELARERGVSHRHRRFAIPDMGVCSRTTLGEIHAAIDSALEAGETVYVHCWGGHGRTGLVIGTWLVSHGLVRAASAVHALTVLRENMPKGQHPSPETAEQIGMLESYESPLSP